MYNSKTITREELCSLFDHTNLKAYADSNAFRKLCMEAASNHFAMVAINSVPVSECKALLDRTGVHVGAAVSFPLGQTCIETKEFETRKAIEDGADEIDYVINIGQLKNGNLAYIEDEMRRITEICRNAGILVKVIFENCYLTREEIRAVAEIARRVRPDYIKTSTGFGTGGATAEDVALMKSIVGDEVKVKAAGGIHTWEECAAMIDAGAERIGTSSAFAILEEYDKAKK